MPFADSTRHEYAMNRQWEPKILIEDSTSGVLRENFYVCGKHLDANENSGLALISDLFPDVTDNFLPDYERVYRLSDSDSTAVRRNRIVTAHRARGGQSESYFEDLGNTLGDGTYTVDLSDGTNSTSPFIVHQYSINTSPQGPASILPAAVYDEGSATTPWMIRCDVSGSSGPEQDLENLFNRLKPAHCDCTYVYTL